MNESAIDLVVLYLDNTDAAWQSEFQKYSGKLLVNSHQFRDWDWMRYWFRGVEKNVPWIGKIHFITCGHLPEWLNLANPKLNVVRHSDYMPQKYLPTFSSIPIELNIHRIDDLSEKFIFANDDFFFLGEMKQEDYFQNGLPCDRLHLCPVTQSRSKGFYHILINNMMALNRHFDAKKCALEHSESWFSNVYTRDIIDDNRAALRWNRFLGIKYDHMPLPLLKSNLKELWDLEPELLDEVCSHKIRDNLQDVNIFLSRFLNLAKGDFVPFLSNTGAYCNVFASEEEIRRALRPENGVACLNDGVGEFSFEERKKLIHSILQEMFSEKSSFEI